MSNDIFGARVGPCCCIPFNLRFQLSFGGESKENHTAPTRFRGCLTNFEFTIDNILSGSILKNESSTFINDVDLSTCTKDLLPPNPCNPSSCNGQKCDPNPFDYKGKLHNLFFKTREPRHFHPFLLPSSSR